MTPGLTMNDVKNDNFTDTKDIPDFFLCHRRFSSKASYLKYLSLNKKSHSVLASTMDAICIAALTTLVGIVVSSSTKEKVIGVNALSVIASVADTKPVGDFANVQSVGDSMGFGASVSPIPQFSVPASVESGLPLPAVVSFNKFCFEPFSVCQVVNHAGRVAQKTVYGNEVILPHSFF
jgi:hypothetical protein